MDRPLCPYCEWPLKDNGDVKTCGICGHTSHTHIKNKIQKDLDAIEESDLGNVTVVDVDEINLSGWKQFLSLFCCPVEEEEYATEHRSAVGILFVSLCIGVFFLSDNIQEAFCLNPNSLFHWMGLNFFTYALVHTGFIHLASNLFFLLPFVDNVEDDLGSSKFFVFISISAAVAGAIHMLFDRSTYPLVGASGVCFAIATYYSLRFPQHRFLIAVPVLGILAFKKRIRIRAWILLLFYFALELLGVFDQRAGISNVSHLGHIGGALSGVLFWIVEKRRHEATPQIKVHSGLH
jgi:membrane associated rhomboid family serine protease